MIKKKVFSKSPNHPQRYRNKQSERHSQHHHARYTSITQSLVLKCITLQIVWIMTMMRMGTVVVAAPPHAAISDNTRSHYSEWPRMKHHDIWSDDDTQELKSAEEHKGDNDEMYDNDSYADESMETPRDFDWSVEYDFMHSTNVSAIPASNTPVSRRQKGMVA